MAHKDPIAVRTTRLNNLIIGKGNAANVGAMKRTPGRRSISSVASSPAVSAHVAQALCRDGLLDAFCLLYNECDKDALRKRDRNVAEFVNKFRSIVEETRLLRVNAEDFTVRSLIGKGYFGNVHLVVERQTGDVYAMKKIKKSVVTTSQVKEERDIMSRRCSEWITNLQYAFQDNENLYLVMEFLPGGDLLSLMSRHGPFDEDMSRFYLAELTLAIHSLHNLGYVHRDIKPENILIDRFGHIKLADFGNSAALDRDGHVLSLSPVGTPDYIAPELLQTISTYKLTKSLHDVSCDFWSMGIIGYELICEVTPFHEENVHETYSKILSHCDDSHLKEIITFPSDVKLSANFKNLLDSLITNPTNRLGYDKIRIHPFFENIKWDTLRSQVPPIIPTVSSEDDTSNYEDVARNKGRASTFAKKSLTTNMKSNDFSGRDLPFIGYSFVHMEKQAGIDDIYCDDVRVGKLSTKLKELQVKFKEQMVEIGNLKQQLVRAEQMSKQSNSQSKILDDAKKEITKMKNIIKEKTTELAACKTQIKTLQSAVKIEEDMWAKKEATITELLRINRQKYEDAKVASEQRYEKIISEKKNEIQSIVQKLEAREHELSNKSDECMHLLSKIDNYKEMLRQFKEKSQKDKSEFEKHKLHLSDTYEKKFMELRSKLRSENDSKTRLTLELRDVRAELNESISSSKSTLEAKNASEKSNDEILQRLNCEIKANNELHKENAKLEEELSQSNKAIQDLQQENVRLERELKVSECSKNLAESTLTQYSSPFETAPGSLSELRDIEEQLRSDLEASKVNENEQRLRAEKLQEVVVKLEEMLEKINEHSLSPTKPHPAPRQMPTSVGDMLEKQNEKLEDKLATVREQMIVERQAARSANLSLWKMEKKLEETLAEKKMTQRRMELTEERIKKVQFEREEAERLYKVAQDETKQRESRIQELRDEILMLKRDVLKEHKMWEKSEVERMKGKSEIIEHISNKQKLEEKLSELREKLQQSLLKSDGLSLENKRLLRELHEEREKFTAVGDAASALQIKLNNLQDNYERLKYACTITDNQLTELETMYEAEQKRNREQQDKINTLYANSRKKDDIITQLKKDLHEEESQKKLAASRLSALSKEHDEQQLNQQELQKKIISQQQQLVEQTNSLFEAQERLELLTNEGQNLQTLNENYSREINILKEESARVLTELFHAKDDTQRLQSELKETLANLEGMHTDIDEMQARLAEKENYYVQRDIKSEATLAQHKKLIDYLQLKVEDLSQKKKKTFTDIIFGGGTNSAKKENISPNIVESSILYRTLQEELRREKLKSKSLQEEIDKFNDNPKHTSCLRSPLKTVTMQCEDSQQNKISANSTTTEIKTASKEKSQANAVISKKSSMRQVQQQQQERHHRFELALQETKNGSETCTVCKNPIVAGSPYWKCRVCKQVTHRKCRGDVKATCGTAVINDSNNIVSYETMPSAPPIDSVSTADDVSVGKYSYEGKLDTVDGETDSTNSINPGCSLLFNVDQIEASEILEVNCAYEMEDRSLLLLGCNSGLFAYHVHSQRFVHIAGIDSVSYIAVSAPLAKAILVGSCGESLYQCDFRQLLSRCQTTACVKPALEASVLDLPFANRASNEKWQLVKISNESENALDSVAIAATSSRIVILKYDLTLQKFKPVRALDTATPVSSILYTRHTAIVSSDKFFEIDLDNYAAEELVDVVDPSLSHASTCQPVVAIRISRQEFLLCFMECGIFVDEFGSRSRPYDVNWEYTPTGFLYREPFLYITHFQTVQILRLHRSYSKEMAAAGTKDVDADQDDAAMTFKRVYLPLYMPTLLAESGKLNAYTIAIQKETGAQQIYHLDAMETFKLKLNESLETISSIATSITGEFSLALSDSI